MRNKVLTLGGYGNFGKRIGAQLIGHDVPVIIAGWDKNKAEALARSLPPVESAVFDATQDLSSWMRRLRPAVVVNTIGAFQTSDYAIARACIAAGAHAMDLADGRQFVTGIVALHRESIARGVAVISGASTVLGLSSAVLAHYQPRFGTIELMTYGISPGQGAERGLATTAGILTYVGKRLAPFAGADGPVYG